MVFRNQFNMSVSNAYGSLSEIIIDESGDNGYCSALRGVWSNSL